MTKPGTRRWLFALIAAAIPLAFFLLLEGLLRLSGFGDDYPLFVELEPAPHYLQPNPEVIKRFFGDPRVAPQVSIDTGYFLAQKPDDALRIVVQGGSSAAGFPYGKFASPAGMLQQRLARAMPGRTVEVVLTAMAAVNSHTLLAFADEIIAIEPDAVVIYAGHNEFIGVLGVGSKFGSARSPAMTRLLLSLRDARVFQFVERAVALLRPTPERRGATLMATIARERSIALDSGLYRAGVEQFRSNLDALLARYARAGIPVFIGTLASNEKDQPPFLGAPEGPDSASWQALATPLREALARNDATAAVQLAERLLATAPDAADSHFLAGRAALAAGNRERARPAFVAAIDRDRLRFRAPSEFERIIRDTAARHGAQVVEVNRALAAASEQGVIGSELMLEHLHPNAEGYFLLGDAFYDAIAASEFGQRWPRITDAQARREQPLTRVEKLHGGYRVTRLMHDWPFVDEREDWHPPPPASVEEDIAQAWLRGEVDWIGAMNQALLHAQRIRDYDEAARIATNLADAFPFEAQPQHVAGQMLVRQTPPDGQRAIPYFHRAASLQPGNPEYLLTLTRAYWINGYRDAARTTAERLMRIAPDDPVVTELMQLLDQAEAADAS